MMSLVQLFTNLSMPMYIFQTFPVSTSFVLVSCAFMLITCYFRNVYESHEIPRYHKDKYNNLIGSIIWVGTLYFEATHLEYLYFYTVVSVIFWIFLSLTVIFDTG